MPKEPGELWDALTAFDADSRQALFAHCVSLISQCRVRTVEPPTERARARRPPGRGRVDLDMVAAGWTPTVDNYLGRVTKARILDAVREAKGERAAQLIDHLKKGEMAEKAQDTARRVRLAARAAAHARPRDDVEHRLAEPNAASEPETSA